MERTILHCDMNNFFASVECMLDPSLKDKAVAVAGSVENRHGIVLAKNYKAKAVGIATGDAIWQAKQKFNKVVIVEPHYEQYIKFSKLAREIYSRYTNQIEPYGMDECFLDITGSQKAFGTGLQIAHKIRRTIKFELGLTISVGVSFNKIFAKLGSDLKKPDAVTCIDKDSFKEKIWGLPASDLLGVGRATTRALNRFGISTIGDLANAPKELIQRRLGKNGLALIAFANGSDCSVVHRTDYVFPIKSIGHGITTIQDLETDSEVWAVMIDLVQDIGTRLRKHKKKACGVSIAIRNNQLCCQEWQCKLPSPTQSSSNIVKTAFMLFQQSYAWEFPIRSVTLRAIDLIEEAQEVQYDLFTDYEAIRKRERLDLTIEEIRHRFGKGAIKNAILLFPSTLPKSRPEITMPTGVFR